MKKGLLVAAVLIVGLVIGNARAGYQRSMVSLMLDRLVDSENQWHYDSLWDGGKEANVSLYTVVGKNVIHQAEVFWLTYRQQRSCFPRCIRRRKKQTETPFGCEKYASHIRVKYVLPLYKVPEPSVETDCRVKAEDAVASGGRKLYERHYSICMTVLLSFMTVVMLFLLVKPRKKK